MTTRKRPAWHIGMLLATTLLLCGCGTARNLTEEGGPHVYGGISTDCDVACENYHSESVVVFFGGLFCTIVDMPFSVIGDTLTLPYVIPAAAGWFGNHASPTPILRPSVDDPPANPLAQPF
jgi:uncharacterized protein YceK